MFAVSEALRLMLWFGSAFVHQAYSLHFLSEQLSCNGSLSTDKSQKLHWDISRGSHTCQYDWKYSCNVAYLVEDMVVALPMQLVRDTRLLQQVGLNQSTTDTLALVEVDLNELAKATAVVVSKSPSIPESLQ